MKVKELRSKFPNNKDPFKEYDSSIKKQMGGGFLPVKIETHTLENSKRYLLNDSSSFDTGMVSPSIHVGGKDSGMVTSGDQSSQLVLP